MRVIVVGGGLGGLTLAHGLRREGTDVVVYERDEPGARRQGLSLYLDDRGTTALRACLPPEHAAMAEATMSRTRERKLLLAEVRGELTVVRARPLDGAVGTTRPGRQASRPLLLAVLQAGLHDTVRFGRRFTRMEQRADGTVRAWFADGSTDTADVLVGADGIGSAVRGHYLPHARLVDSGRRMLLGATPLRAVTDIGLAELIGDSAASAQACGTMMALGVLRFAESPIAVRDRWLPALRARAVAEAEEYVMWALPVTGERPGSAGSSATAWRHAQELAMGLPPTLRLIIDEAWPDFTVALRIGTVPPVPAWRATSVTVIGDAIHAAPGFGGNLAMQDAHRLRDALVQVDRGQQDLPSAIGAFEDALRRDAFPAPAVDTVAAESGA